MFANNLPQSLVRLLTLQEYVMSREQALAAGLPHARLHRLVASGALRKLAPGVYTAAPDDTWLRQAWTGVLMGGDDAVIGLAAARHLHGLGAAPKQIPVWVGRRTWRGSHAGFDFIRGERRGIGLLPRTCVEDTVLDLGSTLTVDDLCRLIADAISEGKTTTAQLRRALDRRPRQGRRSLLNDLLHEVGDGVRSPLERRYFAHVEKAHGLPTGVRQWRDGDGRRCDVGYEWGLIVELDGTAYHRGARRFDDMDRDNAHAIVGHPTVRYGWPHVTSRACETARLVAQALRQLGWVGNIHACSQCRRMPL